MAELHTPESKMGPVLFFLGATVLFTVGPIFLTQTGEAFAAASTCQLATSPEYPVIASDCAMAPLINILVQSGEFLNFTIPIGLSLGVVGLLWLFLAVGKRMLI